MNSGYYITNLQELRELELMLTSMRAGNDLHNVQAYLYLLYLCAIKTLNSLFACTCFWQNDIRVCTSLVFTDSRQILRHHVIIIIIVKECTNSGILVQSCTFDAADKMGRSISASGSYIFQSSMTLSFLVARKPSLIEH